MKKNLHIIVLSVVFSIILWISISLSNDYYATVNVPIKLVNFPTGYSTASDIPKDISVKLKGKGWKLLGVNISTKSDYTISVDDSGRINVNLYNYLGENQWLSSDIEVIDITPDTLSFMVEKDFMKKVSIVSDLDLKFKQGYGLASPVQIIPDSTTLYGPKSVVNNLSFVYTKRKIYKNLDDQTSDQIALEDLPGVIYKNREVRVILNVQQIIDKNFDDIDVRINDLPVDRDVILLPNKISAGIRGGIEMLGKMNNDEIKAYVNYREIVLDTLGSVIPHVEIPENTTLKYIKPARLRYIIKKFN